jgi:hypothetical protein
VDAEKARIVERIGAAELQGGPQSPASIVPWTELGELYAAQREHVLAIAAFERARQLVRTNFGLHTLSQAPLIQRALESQLALGNFSAVRELEQELFDLAERYPDDLRTVAIHRNIGARRMDLLERFIAGERPREIYHDGLYAFMGSTLVAELASEVQIHYADAAAVILRNGLYSSDELRDLEVDMARTSDLFRQRSSGPDSRTGTFLYRPDLGIPDTPRDDYGIGHDLELRHNYTLEALQHRAAALWGLTPVNASDSANERKTRADHIVDHYELGRESYLRLIAYDEATYGSAPADASAWERRLEAHLELADWDLVYSRNELALDAYERAYEMLDESGSAEPLRAKLFTPAVPTTLPTFLANPLQTPTSARYIDVAFEITTYGEARRVELRGAAPGVGNDSKRGLVSLIKGSRFRPRIKDGELGRSSVLLRYYLPE